MFGLDNALQQIWPKQFQLSHSTQEGVRGEREMHMAGRNQCQCTKQQQLAAHRGKNAAANAAAAGKVLFMAVRRSRHQSRDTGCFIKPFFALEISE